MKPKALLTVPLRFRIESVVRSRTKKWAQALVAGTMVASSTLLAQDVGPTGQPFPSLQLPAPASGEALIQGLGAQLPAVAAFYATDPNVLRAFARQDQSLRANTQGRLFYVCDGLVANAPAEAPAAEGAAGPIPLDQTFLLHSRPGASR